jgi:hypothetical protein
MSPAPALYYNDHPDAIFEDFDRSDYGTVIRAIERHVVDWERQQTPEQAEWVARMRRRRYLSSEKAEGRPGRRVTPRGRSPGASDRPATAGRTVRGGDHAPLRSRE